MTDASDDRATHDRRTNGEARGTRAWQAPTLTVLGDARTMTEAGGVNIPDGGGNNRS